MNRRDLLKLSGAAAIAATLPLTAVADTGGGDTILMMSARELTFAATTFNSDVTPTLHRTISHRTGRASAALSRFQVRLLRFQDPVNVEVYVVARNANYRIVEVHNREDKVLMVYRRTGASSWVVADVFRGDCNKKLTCNINGAPSDYWIEMAPMVKYATQDATEVYADTRLRVSEIDGVLAITFKSKLFTYA